MKGTNLHIGDFEEIVLLAILRLQDNAHGSAVRELLEEATSRSISVGAFYTTINRLEQKGLIHSRTGEGAPERGGRARRYFELDGPGKEALKQADGVRKQLVPKLATALKS